VRGEDGPWTWTYKVINVDVIESHWLSEEEAKDSFTPLQLDVFHALWEANHGEEKRPRLTLAQTKAGRDAEERKRALNKHPVGTVVWRTFKETERKEEIHREVVYDSNHPSGG